jgi:hypothetical protein
MVFLHRSVSASVKDAHVRSELPNTPLTVTRVRTALAASFVAQELGRCLFLGANQCLLATLFQLEGLMLKRDRGLDCCQPRHVTVAIAYHSLYSLTVSRDHSYSLR